jgi:hypothetical protein
MQYTAIKGGHLCISSAPTPCPQHPPLFSAASSVPSRLTPRLSPYACPRGSLDSRATPQPEGPALSLSLSSGAVDRTGEFRPLVARLSRFDLELATVSSECIVGWGSLQCTHCRGLATGESCHGTRSERVGAKRTASCVRCTRTRAASCGQPGR